MKHILLLLLFLPFLVLSQKPPPTPTNTPLRLRTATDEVTRDAYRAEAKRKADSASMAGRKDLKAFKDSVNLVISSIFGRMPVDTFTQLQADERYATKAQNNLKQNTADAFTQAQADNRYPSNLTFANSVTKFYGASGLINKPMKIWGDTGIVVTANPMPVNISSAGFTVITSIQVVARNAGGLLSSVPIVAERPPHSNTTIYFSLAASNLLGVVGLLTNFTGTTLSVRVEGY